MSEGTCYFSTAYNGYNSMIKIAVKHGKPIQTDPEEEEEHKNKL